MHLLLGFQDRWLVKTVTQISAHWYSWQTWLIPMHYFQKTFHFLNVPNGSTSVLSDIASNPTWITRNQPFWGIFEKSQIIVRYVLQMSQRRHEKNIFFEICSRSLKDVTQKKRYLFWDVFETFQRRHRKEIFFWDVFQKSHLLWDVSKRSLRCLSQWRSLWDICQLGSSLSLNNNKNWRLGKIGVFPLK